jgi:hypothetical protein
MVKFRLEAAGVLFEEKDITAPEHAKDLAHFVGIGYRSAPINTDRVDGDALHLGHIIGVVDLVDVHDPTVPLFGLTGCQGECTPWSEMGQWHLVLANPRALDEPIPWKGALGLRKTDLELVGDYLAAPWGHPNRSCTPYGCEPGCELEPVARLVATS